MHEYEVVRLIAFYYSDVLSLNPDGSYNLTVKLLEK